MASEVRLGLVVADGWPGVVSLASDPVGGCCWCGCVFRLALPTIWIPHSYPACAQHAPDEHLLAPLARQALQLMAGLFWDLGEQPC
ncbi:MAG TPA: hypothetical protein VGL63_06785 [Streptosporangiaceae bacterium]|jgi:hypothetical protein